LILPIVIFFVSLGVGSYPIPFDQMVDIILYKLSGYTIFNKQLSAQSINVLLNIRLPRVALGLVVGGALAVSGTAFQGVMRNPLVEPYTLGLSSGAAFGAALAMAVVNVPVQLCAFCFAGLSVGISYLAASKNGETSVISLVLSGVVVASVFTAMLSILQITIDPLQLQGLVYWLMGSLHTASWEKLLAVLPYLVVGYATIYFFRWKLNILSLGEKDAVSLGVNPQQYKLLFIGAATLLASAAVSVTGIISLVGLMIPHMLRMLFGPDNTKLIPLSFCLGASYLSIVDMISRNLLTYEIPIGIFTTFLGAPYFIFLIRKTREGGWN
jgi:iron complex transport system permease protein